jgi:3-hydroxymyristoyl/3-hydroxydecanoyl-(acyl carrier protein) dehydratase
MLPMDDFVDPKIMRMRFESMFRPECIKIKSVTNFIHLLEPNNGLLSDACRLPLLDRVNTHVYGKHVVASKNTSHTESYLIDHFPRRPIVPGVILLSTIGEAAQLLARPAITDQPQVFLLPSRLDDLRFRSFVCPGDELQIALTTQSGAFIPGETVVISARIETQQKRVLTGKMSFHVYAIPTRKGTAKGC